MAYLLDAKSLLELASWSCDGEPAPERVVPAMLPRDCKPGGFPKGDLAELPFGGSIGDVFPVDGPERGCSSREDGRNPKDG